MLKVIVSLKCVVVMLVVYSQESYAVHPLPQIRSNCYYSIATPHRPDPRNEAVETTAAQRCGFADVFALSNVPTVPVSVIRPNSTVGNYCTLDGVTIANPKTVDGDPFLNPESLLAGPTSCNSDDICKQRFSEQSTCETFGRDASGSSAEGWTSVGPATGFAIAAPLDGSQGAHAIYVRDTNNQGNIFYFSSGVYRTHSLTGPQNADVKDITFCRAPASFLVQRTRDTNCEGFFCRPIPCNGPHFPTAGEPNFPPLVPTPEFQIIEIAKMVDSLTADGLLPFGQARSMEAHLTAAQRHLDEVKLPQTCKQLAHFKKAVEKSIKNGSLVPDDGQPLMDATVFAEDNLRCL